MSDGQYARAAEYEEEVLGLPTDAEVRVAAAWQFGVIQSALGRYREAIARLVAIADAPMPKWRRRCWAGPITSRGWRSRASWACAPSWLTAISAWGNSTGVPATGRRPRST